LLAIKFVQGALFSRNQVLQIAFKVTVDAIKLVDEFLVLHVLACRIILSELYFGGMDEV
jgi:hypothetical protein